MSGGRTSRRRSTFVVAQLALSVLLLVIAGLFVRSLRRGTEADLGFDPSDVVVATIDVGSHGYDPERGRAFYEQLVERVRARPDVVSAAIARFVLLGGGDASTPVRAASDASGTTRTSAGYSISDTAYFSTLRFELVAGRAFATSDRSGAPAVAIVNEALAERLWPGENAVGQRFLRGRRDEPIEVIGVVRDGKYVLVTEERAPFFFLPFAREYTSTMALHVRTTPGSDGILDHIRREVRALDPNIAVEGARVLERVVEVSLSLQRFAVVLTGLFGLVGLVLAAIGVYGVLSMHVAQRGREFGIRMALGARSSDVLRLVLARGAMLALAGVMLGLVAAASVTRLIRSFLYGVGPVDPLTFLAVAALLVGIALLASYIPARRATQADTLAPLRQE